MLSRARPSSGSDSELSMLIDNAVDWAQKTCPVTPEHTFDRVRCLARWRSVVELGWPGVAMSEESGGSGMGFIALGAILSALGQQLVALPLLSNALFAHALTAAKPRGSAAGYLSQIVSGERIGALAFGNAQRSQAASGVTAEATASGWRLSGQVRFVRDAQLADVLLISAAGSAPGLYVVEKERLTCQALDMIDGRDYGHVTFDDAQLLEAARLEVHPTLTDSLRDLARIGLAAEMLGASERALSITVDYLKVREQFGRKIGTFQALQHRAAQMVVDIELARSCVDAALRAVDADASDVRPLAALAKFTAGAAMHRASLEIVQMHGGIGMTAEHVAGRYLKWARVSETLYGNRDTLANDYALSKGF